MMGHGAVMRPGVGTCWPVSQDVRVKRRVNWGRLEIVGNINENSEEEERNRLNLDHQLARPASGRRADESPRPRDPMLQAS
ncbi:hypothetical protein ElyMa_006879900 [Elysia marginata]|uniref:Uncharacterized protein n=1 Tax=Elysia marginata TaxID=1093978 RepID=A0AAV4JE90_9GAST|nr:hypothetical protein ElyMa_006879900 [Elysia marginata]